MNKLRTLVYGVLDGVENRVEAFLMKLEGVFGSTVDRLITVGQDAIKEGVRIVFGLIEVVVEESFSLVNAVVELVIGKRDTPFPTGGVLCGSSLPDWEDLGSVGGNFDLDDIQTPSEVEEEDN